MPRTALLDPLTDPAWARLVGSAPDATIFHHPAWLGLVRRQYRYPFAAVCVLDGDGTAVAGLPLPGEPRTLAISVDKVMAAAQHAFVSCADGKLRVVDLKSPVMPRKVAEMPGLVDPRASKLAGGTRGTVEALTRELREALRN